VKSSVDSDRQFELDALGCSEPVKTGKSICNYDPIDEDRRSTELPR